MGAAFGKSLSIYRVGLAAALVLVLAVAGNLSRQAAPLTGEAVVFSAPGVAIDAGHGGYDGGAQWNGVIEKDVNLAISLQLREILLASGCRVAMTRYGDYSLIEEQETSNPKKREDMARRLAVIERHAPDVIILIHCNAINSTRWSGAQTFYQEESQQGKLLAEDIQFYLSMFTDTGRKSSPLNLYLLRESSIVGSLVEAGFLSNSAERELLTRTDHQRRIAAATWLGLAKYLHYPESHSADN